MVWLRESLLDASAEDILTVEMSTLLAFDVVTKLPIQPMSFLKPDSLCSCSIYSHPQHRI